MSKGWEGKYMHNNNDTATMQRHSNNGTMAQQRCSGIVRWGDVEDKAKEEARESSGAVRSTAPRAASSRYQPHASAVEMSSTVNDVKSTSRFSKKSPIKCWLLLVVEAVTPITNLDEDPGRMPVTLSG